MDCDTYNPIAAASLTAAGWYPTRHVDASLFCRCLEHCGYGVHPNATKLLYEFGGLSIGNRRSGARPTVTLQIGVCSVYNRFLTWSGAHLGRWFAPPIPDGRYATPVIQRFINEDVCYIGTISSESLRSFLFIARSGAILLADNEWWALGHYDSFATLLESLCLMKDAIKWLPLEEYEDRDPELPVLLENVRLSTR
jgi:hypothetical protein